MASQTNVCMSIGRSLRVSSSMTSPGSRQLQVDSKVTFDCAIFKTLLQQLGKL